MPPRTRLSDGPVALRPLRMRDGRLDEGVPA